MPLYLYQWPSFKRSCKQLDQGQKAVVAIILKALIAYYQSNCNLIYARRIAPRFFYKQLRKPFYEAGVESNIRVIIRRENEKCIAVLAGNHDQIRKFLSKI